MALDRSKYRGARPAIQVATSGLPILDGSLNRLAGLVAVERQVSVGRDEFPQKRTLQKGDSATVSVGSPVCRVSARYSDEARYFE